MDENMANNSNLYALISKKNSVQSQSHLLNAADEPKISLAQKTSVHMTTLHTNKKTNTFLCEGWTLIISLNFYFITANLLV